MSHTIIELSLFRVSRFSGISNLRMYQITTGGGYIQLSVVQIINLREVLKAICFDSPPCNEAELHTTPRILGE
jgi:hypothetical protein